MSVNEESRGDGAAPLIVHLDRETMGGFDIPRPTAPHRWQVHDFTGSDQVIARLAGAQVAIINKVFTPSAQEVEKAREIVNAFAATPSSGVVGIGGVMYDRPHLRRAERLLARANPTSSS